MNDGFIHKYMITAKNFGQTKNSCKSRQIGAIVVNPNTHNIIGCGYNGSARGLPHCDSRQYLEEYALPLLNERDIEVIRAKSNVDGESEIKKWFVDNCEFNCPRKFLNYKSGERIELCAELHAERNAILNSNGGCHNCYMFAWCGVPCPECALHIVNSGITRVYCLSQNAYGTSSNREYERAIWIFEKAKVKLVQLEEKNIGVYVHTTTNGYEFTVDIDDKEFISSLSWHKMPSGYIQCKTKPYKDKYVHRILLEGVGKNIVGLEVDHKDRNKSNNCKENLRPCTHIENHMNKDKHSNNTSGSKGVYLDKTRNKWVAEIRVNSKKKFLGRFDTKEGAAKAYQDASLQYFGDFLSR